MNRLVVTTALSVAIALLCAAGYAVWLSRVNALTGEAEALAATIASEGQRHAKTLGARDALSELAEDEAFVAGMLVPEDGVVPFLETLEGLGTPFGARTSVVAVGNPDAAGRILVSVSVTGSFDAVVRAIGRIEHGPFASVTRELALDRSDEGLWTAALTLSVLAPRSL